LKLNSAKDPNNEFVKYGQKFFGSGVSLQLILVLLFPEFATETLNFHGFQPEASNFFFNLTKQIVKQRKESNSDSSHNDFIDLLMKANYEGRQLTEKQIADQGIAFFLAGFDTSSVSLTNVTYLLAKHQDIQDELVKEIDEFWNSKQEINLESVNELKYLEAVINETMRILPTVPRMFKDTAKNCTVSYAGRNLYIPKGSNVQLSIHMIHRDEQHFERPLEFLPERFLKDSNLKHDSQAFIPFGIGPRNCIGQRFAMFEIKLCLLTVLSKFRFELTSTTEPLKFLAGQPVTVAEKMLLKLIKR